MSLLIFLSISIVICFVSQEICLTSRMIFPLHKLLISKTPSIFDVVYLFKFMTAIDAPSIGVLSWKSIILPLKVILQSCAAVFVLIQYKNAHKKISLCILVFYVQKKLSLNIKRWSP